MCLLWKPQTVAAPRASEPQLDLLVQNSKERRLPRISAVCRRLTPELGLDVLGSLQGRRL